MEVGRIRREQSEYALRLRLVSDATWRCRHDAGAVAARRSALHVGAPTWIWRVGEPIVRCGLSLMTRCGPMRYLRGHQLITDQAVVGVLVGRGRCW
jgi:hypothetical protein